MTGLAACFAEFVYDTHFEKLPPEVVRHTKQRVLDLFGVALAGSKLMEFPRIVLDYLTGLGGVPEATVIQRKTRVPAIHAAFANACCAHALDMDDGHRFAALHPGTVIIPAALAAAELTHANSQEMLTGIVAGYEITIRIGMAINPSSLKRGFHATGIAGCFGAAAAAANILRLDPAQTVNAFGLAGLQAAGLLQANHEEEGAKAKPINPARAAMSGIFSSILAQRGAVGPVHIFEGEDGFLKAFTDSVKDELLVQGLGIRFEVMNTYDKLYAACRHAHAPIDAALEARRTSRIDAEDIRHISIETYSAAIRLAGIVRPPTPSAARFSIPFSVALALLKNDASADKYSEETIGDETIQQLADLVSLSVSDRWESAYPEQRGATVRITDSAGRSSSADVALAKGEPENPASSDELFNKFMANATVVLPERQATALANIIQDLENQPLDELIRLVE